jgi:adenine-specific DNA-methyltransferase
MDAVQLPLLDTTAEPPAAAAIAADDAACLQMPAEWRRQQGVTLTPAWLVERMLDRVAAAGPFDTLVDAGAGSGRFAIAAAQRFPSARVVCVERNEAMLALLRNAVAAAGLQGRMRIVGGDFREGSLPRPGRTAFIGNPPYVRHHDIEPAWKRWYGDRLAAWGVSASQLAGLHLHFLARAVELAQVGDLICWVTAAEWLDNGYGQAWRQLLAAEGGPIRLRGLWLAPADEPVFRDALVSAAVLEAECASPCTSAASVALGAISGGALVTHRRLELAALQGCRRWGPECHAVPVMPTTGVEVGELFRVTRGQVTGSNAAWLLSAGSASLPAHRLRPAVTKAREIIDGTLEAPDALLRLRRLPDLPVDLDSLPAEERALVDAFLRVARERGAADGYVARQRRAWHALDLRPAPPVIVSYMGRRPPVFRANPHGATYLNIAHGLYPRQALAPVVLSGVIAHLNRHTDIRAGRIYGGGLAKFEPSDIARLRIPAQVLEGAP